MSKIIIDNTVLMLQSKGNIKNTKDYNSIFAVELD